jgi:hypothetical protein
VRIASTLDTLYDGSSLLLIRLAGSAHDLVPRRRREPVRVHRFTPWLFKRADCIGLTDFVLQDLWGLVRQPVDRGLVDGAARGRGAPPRSAGTRAARGAAGRAP